MFLLDTNVISEAMKPSPDSRVDAWLSARAKAEIAIATVSAAEVMFGLARLPEGARRTVLEAAFERVVHELQIYDFNFHCAALSAQIRLSRSAAGKPITFADALIAATARAYDCIVVTRDVAGFEACGVELLNPWTSG